MDTNVLYDDIVRRLRRQQDRTALVESARRGAIRLFAPDRVYDEIYDHLSGFDRRSVDRNDVLRVFKTVYLAACRFVRLPGGEPHPRVVRVATVDESDVPRRSSRSSLPRATC